MKTDAISIVEAAYDFEPDERAWLRRLLERAAPKLDRGLGVTIWTYAPNMRPDEALVHVHRVERRIVDAMNAMVVANPDMFRRIHTFGAVHTATQALGITAAQERTWAPTLNICIPWACAT